MKGINVKPKIKLPKVNMPKKPNVGMRMPKVAGVIQALRFNR